VTYYAQEDFSTPWAKVPDLLLPAYGQTWLMVGVTMVLVLLIGIPVGIILHNTSGLGLFPTPRCSGSSTRSSTSAGHCRS
jgi:ABC-type methionine transport system permease subunit